MAFDGIAVSAIAVELNQKLNNARVAKIYQHNRHTIIIHLRDIGQTHKLLLSADPKAPRIHTTTALDPNPQNPPAFCMLLRKHLEPSRVLAVEQVDFERILIIKFETYDLDSGPGQKSIVLELMGRNSNIILIGRDQTIIDAIYRNNDPNHPRPIMPGIGYQLPPVHNKLNPKRSTATEFVDELRLLPASTPVVKALVERYQGLGPQAAAEICARAILDPELKARGLTTAQMDSLWQSLVELVNASPQPTMITSPKPDFFAYKPIGSTEVENVQEFATLDELLDHFYTIKTRKQQLRQAATRLQNAVNAQLKRLQRKEEIHRSTLQAVAVADEWQKWGEIILTNIYLIKKGDHQLEAIDFYQPEQPLITIELDPRLSPSENAQYYFKKYAKAKRSAKIAAEQLQEILDLETYLKEISVHIQQADDLETLADIEAELTREGLIAENAGKRRRSAQGKTEKRSKPYDQYLASDGTPILLGRNNRQNDIVTFKVAKPEHLWLHAQKAPGSHVIVCSDKEVSQQTLLEAATLAAYYSQNRDNPKVAVDFTKRKHVRKPPQAKPGFVIYDHFQTIIVDPTKSVDMPRKRIRTQEAES